MADPERNRLVVLGDAGVGKSAICKRFLYNSFCSKYKTTVEDLYTKEFSLGTAQHFKVSHNILDIILELLKNNMSVFRCNCNIGL